MAVSGKDDAGGPPLRAGAEPYGAHSTADAAKLHARAEADVMALRAKAESLRAKEEAKARRVRAAAEADVARTLRSAYGPAPSSSLSVKGGGFRLRFKGGTTALVTAVLLAAAGTTAYVLLPHRADGATRNPAAGKASAPGTHAPTPGADVPQAAVSPSSGGSGAAPGPDAGVRQHRKVVFQPGSTVDLDNDDSADDIGFMSVDGSRHAVLGVTGDLARIDGVPTAESCARATEFGFTVSVKNIRRGQTACVLTDANRYASITVLGWRDDEATGDLSTVTVDAVVWEKTEGTV